MRKDNQSATSSHLTIVTQPLVLVLIICFAGSAAGSCLSYGHSCWGAHGKRSGIDRFEQQRPVDNNPDSGVVGAAEIDGNAPTLNNQGGWFITRLITGRLAIPASTSNTDERRNGNRWLRTRENYAMPANENIVYDGSTNEIFRNEEPNINVDSNEYNKETSATRDLSRKIGENFVPTQLFFIPSRLSYDRRPSLAQTRPKQSTVLNNVPEDKLQ